MTVHVMQGLTYLGHWFLVYPFVGIIALLTIGIVTFGAAGSLGVPDMFWRQPPARAFVVGISLAVLFLLICFNGFLLESGGHGGANGSEYFWDTYPVLFALLLVGAWRYRREGEVPDHGRVLALLAGHVLTVAAFLGLSTLLMPRIIHFASRPGVVSFMTRGDIQAEDVPYQVTAAMIFTALFIAYVILAVRLPRIPSGTAISIVFSLTLLVYGAIRVRFPHERMLIFALLAVWIAVASYVSKYRHRFPEIAELYANPAKIPGGPNPELIANDEAFLAWAKHVGGKPKLVVVAASGGGIRSAVWTGTVLQHLSKEIPDFAKYIRILSGASGGMVGAANYVAAIDFDGVNLTNAAQVRDVAKDSMEDVVRTFALRDLPALLLPGHYPDRGVALEDAWKRESVVMRKSFADLGAGERAGWRPSLIFTPMFVEDGRRALISNLDLGFLANNTGPQLTDPPHDLYSVANVELFKVIPAARSLSVASAARMNASFPGTSPSASVPTDPERHIVDAAYWDNYGIATSMAWLQYNFRNIMENTSGVLLLQIRDVLEEQTNQSPTLPAGRNAALAAFSDVAAPVLGILSARGAVSVFRNDRDVQEMAATFAYATGDPEFFTTVVLENPKKSVLSWALTSRQSDEMITYFEKAKPDEVPVRRIAKLKEWFRREPRAQPETSEHRHATRAAELLNRT
jgi:hypothetical protein